jgi:stearoyl-CoA desaturase (delta-9 desaturase)
MTTSSDVIDDAPKAHNDTTLPSATLGGEQKRSIEQITLLLFITVPFLALLAAVPAL